MSRKRKTEATRLDEVDRTMYSTFCSAANSLSQLYTQAMNRQKASFQAGERHALEKLYQWMMRKQEEGPRFTVADIVTHIQNEMDYYVVNDAIGSRSCQTTMQMPNSGIQHLSALFGQPTAGLAPRSAHSDQSKNSVFSNALSSPVRRSLHPFHLDHEGGFYTNGAGLPIANTESRNHDPCQNREANSLGSNYSSMDIHTDSPPRGSY